MSGVLSEMKSYKCLPYLDLRKTPIQRKRGSQLKL